MRGIGRGFGCLVGSSSGAASSVAQELCDFGLGSDTGGSVRIPSSYCGLYGIRPTHGRVDIVGARPLAPSFDTVGWMARDIGVLQAVGEVLLEGKSHETPITRWMVGTDAFALADPAVSKAIYAALSGQDSSRFQAVCEAIGGEPTEVTVAPPDGSVAGGDLATWWQHFRVLQASEVWACHGQWVEEVEPAFGPGIRERFQMAKEITADEVVSAAAARDEIVKHLDTLLCGGVLMVPTAPGPGTAPTEP
ncbi:Amidase 1, partial [Cymbomonas tetramitiformis]